MYNSITHDISVSVYPAYIEERSDPDSNRYFWAYRVVIENKSSQIVQLVSRFWKITDANGRIEQVQGAGVVGEQPILKPGDAFEYTSGCPLDTPSGIMEGHYEMKIDEAKTLQVMIPAFSLDLPNNLPTYN